MTCAMVTSELGAPSPDNSSSAMSFSKINNLQASTHAFRTNSGGPENSGGGSLHQAVASIVTTAIAIATVASQPRNFSRRLITNGPMTSSRVAISIITTMIGTAMTPLITALQNKALIGSIGVKSSSTPPSVAMAMIA